MKELLETLNKPLEGSLSQDEQDEIIVLEDRVKYIYQVLETFPTGQTIMNNVFVAAFNKCLYEADLRLMNLKNKYK